MTFADLAEVALPIQPEPLLREPVFCGTCGLQNSAFQIVTNDFICVGCLDEICLWCGCTQSRACDEGCYWLRPGVCSSHLEAIASEVERVFG